MLLFVLLVALAPSLHAEKSLRWSQLAVTANLDADGLLHVAERHTIVFNGDWNGGERSFRRTLEEDFRLIGIRRIDETGKAIPLRKNKKLSNVDVNHPNFSGYVGNIRSPLFGLPTTASAGRRLQLSVSSKF